MKTTTKAAATHKPAKARKAGLSSLTARRRAEDEADYALAAKRADAIDAGKSKLHTREEVLRELGLSV